MGVMVARRLWLTVVGLLCGLACVLVAGVVPALAGTAAQFGSNGEGAGEFKLPAGVALDRATGDVYVADTYNHRVDKFGGSGSFLFAWGWGVDESNPAGELQTCTVATGCRGGAYGTGAGEFNGEGPEAVAVDDDPLSSSYGDVYVVDLEGLRVEKFDPSGKFLLTFGYEVNEGKDNTPGATEAEKNVCVPGERCTLGKQGSANAQFEWAFRAGGIVAVGPGGAVYVGDKTRVQVFDASGAWRENVSLVGLSSTGKVTSLAVNSAGDVFVKDEGVSGVREFEPGGIEKAMQFDAGSESVEAVTVDGAGEVFVADSSGGFHVVKYGASGEQLDSFGSKTAVRANGLAFSDALGELYVSDPSSSVVWILTTPPPGPLIEPGSESAVAEPHGSATLHALVNPEGAETTYHFEYVAEARFNANGYASATSTTPTSAGASFEDQTASATLRSLAPGVYHYRIIATNSHGTATGPDQTLNTVLIEGPWVKNVSNTSATFEARVNPLGTSTEYRLEYGTSSSYGHSISGDLGEGTSYAPISIHRQDLQPLTEYHYRLVIKNEFGTFEGADHTLTTQGVGGTLTLPDGRAWELVSPPDKKAALIKEAGAGSRVIKAAADGGATVYDANDALGEGAVGKAVSTPVISARGAGGWRSEDISVPATLPPEGTPAGPVGQEASYELFSSDLSLGVVEQPSEPEPPLSPEATERTPYLRSVLTCGIGTGSCFTPLLTASNVQPPGTKFGGKSNSDAATVEGASPDLSHLVLRYYGGSGSGLYEWSGGRLQSVPGAGVLGRRNLEGNSDLFTAHAVSSDGRRIVDNSSGVSVTDMVRGKTVTAGGGKAIFQTMSADGTRVFYIENGDLYELNVDTGAQSDLTAGHGAGEPNAGVKEVVMSPSEGETPSSSHEMKYVYFIATGVLANDGVSGGDNLYVLHYGASGPTITFIGSLSGEDQQRPAGSVYASSRASANGRYLAFMSNRALTGYDNHDAASGQPDEEVYLYDAVANRLVCVSCNPTGARPVGVLDDGRLSVDSQRVWEGKSLAGIIPSWQTVQLGTNQPASFYQARFLSDSGRLFFDSPDALVPLATNGLTNVYEYEPAGIGGCTSASVTFNAGSGGCVSLISDGTSGGESMFYDASENGNDVFFITLSRLTGEDYDTAYDVYDAHLCSDSAPCHVVPVSPPPCTSGDSCKAAPKPQPEIFGPAPSATFSGTGNVIEEAHKSKVVKRKAKKPKHKRRVKHKKRRRGRASGSSMVGKSSGKGGRR
jgi:hypothetical protein